MTNFRVVQANYYARRYDEAVRAGRIAIAIHIFLPGLVHGGDRSKRRCVGIG
jgi:hypothetical protein